MSRTRICLDLDNVFADWNSFVKNEIGQDYSPHVWYELDQIDNIFLKLDIIPGAKEMFDYIWSMKDRYDILILTAIPHPTNKLITCIEDKRKWVATHLSPDIHVHTTVGGHSKYHWINRPGDILIDDLQRNIEIWNDNLGTGILHVPGEHNSTIERLNIELDKI
jgi:5'(3')-deoxyribonucleotidase